MVNSSNPNPQIEKTVLTIPSDHLSVGMRVGSYRIQSILAEGGMGRVYLAEQIPSGRLSVVKTILPRIQRDPTYAARFLREIKIVSSLRHPNIISFYDGGQEGDLLYLAMEYFPGRSLAQCIEGELAPLGEVISIGIQVADALEFARTMGMIHRDIKPSNLLVDESGRAKVLDFGLAKMLNESTDHHLTATGMVLGSPSYMAPESILDSKHLTHLADVYGLGAVLYYCLTGSPPFTGRNAMEVVTRLSAFELEPPRSRRPDVPPELEAIVLKAMAKDPSARFPTAGALKEALERFAKTLPPAQAEVKNKEKEDTTTPSTTLRPNLLAPPFHVLRIFGPDKGVKEFYLPLREHVIGRSSSADIQLVDEQKAVSRLHAKLEPVGIRFMLQDLGSRAGTWLNGVKIDRAPLRHGDTIQIAEFVLEYRAGPPPSASRDNTKNREEEMRHRRFGLLPAGMQYRHRWIECPPEKVFVEGDTIAVGAGGLLLRPENGPQENACHEILLVWPNGESRRFLAEVLGTVYVRNRLMNAVKLHRVPRETHEKILKTSKTGPGSPI